MSILSGEAIRNAVACGVIEIDPFDPELVNPVSVDLRLGNFVRTYNGNIQESADVIDSAREHPTWQRAFSGLVLYPGYLYLMHTAERVKTDKYVPVLDGKSSIGRLGICVHLSAGFGDPGFNGQYTLEVTAAQAVKVYAGMRFCQMRFHTIETEGFGLQLYQGNYTEEGARGAVASRAWKQFEGKKP